MAETLDGIIENIQIEIEADEDTIAKFSEDVKKSPLGMLEWSDNAFICAARLDLNERILRALFWLRDKGPLTEERVQEALQSIDGVILYNLRSVGVSDSTSTSQRLGNIARVQVSNGWFGNNPGLSRMRLERALTAQ